MAMMPSTGLHAPCIAGARVLPDSIGMGPTCVRLDSDDRDRFRLGGALHPMQRHPWLRTSRHLQWGGMWLRPDLRPARRPAWVGIGIAIFGLVSGRRPRDGARNSDKLPSRLTSKGKTLDYGVSITPAFT